MNYYDSLVDYAERKKIDWRTARARLKKGIIYELKFKGKKVYVAREDIVLFLLCNYTT